MAETRQGTSSVAAIIFAAFAIVCFVAFLAHRGGDVGQLPQLLGNFVGGPLFGENGIRHFVDALKAFAIAGAWLGVGVMVMSLLRKFAGFDLPPRVGVILCFAIGSAGWSVVWFLLGAAGLYNEITAVAALIMGMAALVVAGFILKRTGHAEGPEKKEKLISIGDKALLVLIFIQLALSFVAALAPPIAKDTLLYHFAVPKAFIAQGSNAIIEGNIASYLSLGTEMHVVWARLLANERGVDAASGAVVWVFLPLLLIAIYGWALEIGLSRTWSLIGTLIVATIPTAYHVASSGYVDLSLALYVTLATYSLTRWWKEQTWGWVILMAIFLGAALSVKLTALFVFAAFALVVLLRARGGGDTQAGSLRSDGLRPGRVAASGFVALMLAGVVASPWYLRTWAATGSPVFPFYMSILPAEAPGWDVERSNLFQAMNSRYGGLDKTPIDYLLAPWNLSVAAQPEVPERFDGVLGIAFLIGLPILVWGLWKFDMPVATKIASGVAAVMFLFWLFSSQQLRYLLPIAPLLAIAIVAAAEKVSMDARLRQVLRYGFVLPGIAGILVISAWFLRTSPVCVVLGGETRDEYLTRNLDYYPYYKWINTETASDERIWLINMRRDTYHIDRPLLSDYFFEDWTLRHMVWDSTSTQELRDKAAARGIKYVLTRHDFLFDYDRSTLVDDRKPRAENEAKLRMAREFILDPANTIKSDGKFSLVKVL